MHSFIQAAGSLVFKKWLDAHLPSCNDNDDPDHDRTVTIARPDRNTQESHVYRSDLDRRGGIAFGTLISRMGGAVHSAS